MIEDGQRLVVGTLAFDVVHYARPCAGARRLSARHDRVWR
jgi:hypothetical protein